MENKNKQRLCGMIGFAMRAGKLVIGTELICRAMPNGNIKLVAVATDASAATKKKLFAKSGFYSISAIEVDFDSHSLGDLIGKTYAPSSLRPAYEEKYKRYKAVEKKLWAEEGAL